MKAVIYKINSLFLDSMSYTVEKKEIFVFRNVVSCDKKYIDA